MLLLIALGVSLSVACASGGGPGEDPTPDASEGPAVDASTKWSCFESPGTLCLCDTGSDRELDACSAGWSCCLMQGTATRDICQCYHQDEAACAATAAEDPGLVRVAQCPPG